MKKVLIVDDVNSWLEFHTKFHFSDYEVVSEYMEVQP